MGSVPPMVHYHLHLFLYISFVYWSCMCSTALNIQMFHSSMFILHAMLSDFSIKVCSQVYWIWPQHRLSPPNSVQILCNNSRNSWSWLLFESVRYRANTLLLVNHEMFLNEKMLAASGYVSDNLKSDRVLGFYDIISLLFSWKFLAPI